MLQTASQVVGRATYQKVVDMTKKDEVLRPWQSDHLQACLESFAKGKKPIWLSQVVTGGGKTTFGAHAAASLMSQGDVSRVVILAPSVEIAQGWKDKMGKVGTYATYGITVSASFENVQADDVNVIVSTYQGAGKLFGTPDTLVILDEIHHAEREASWGLVADRIASASKYTIALTGTPWMTKGRIAILDKHGYYKPAFIQKASGERVESAVIVADATYEYAEDLKAVDKPDEGIWNRATVPLQCTFFDSSTQQKTKDEKGNEVVRNYHLLPVTDENRDDIISQANETIPLRPHVYIADNFLSNNGMARNLLCAAMTELDKMAESKVFKSARKKPMGLVTCCNISEARLVEEYMTSKDVTAELICSDDEKSAQRLRAISSGKESNPPDWIVSVGMVSEGVDIPAIKVIAFLNQITTTLFLVQLIGRALRRIPVGKGYLDRSLTSTTARLFAPAHPKVVKVGTDLERISNQAIQDRKSKTPGEDPPEERPAVEMDCTTENQGATIFYRGVAIKNHDLVRKISALYADADAMETLTPIWLDMVHAWIANGNEDAALEEANRRLVDFDINWERDADSYKEGMDYDTERSLLKKEARRVVTLVRFSSPVLKVLPDQDAYRKARRMICEASVLGKFKKVEKMTNDELRSFNSTGKAMYQRLAA